MGRRLRHLLLVLLTMQCWSHYSLGVLVETETCDPDTMGDADGNFAVEFADLLIWSTNWGREDVDHTQGNFDCDREVHFSDFLTLNGNYGRDDFGSSSPPSFGSPELPLTIAVNANGMMSLVNSSSMSVPVSGIEFWSAGGHLSLPAISINPSEEIAVTTPFSLDIKNEPNWVTLITLGIDNAPEVPANSSLSLPIIYSGDLAEASADLSVQWGTTQPIAANVTAVPEPSPFLLLSLLSAAAIVRSRYRSI